MVYYKLKHLQVSECGKHACLHVDAKHGLYLADLQRKVITVGYNYVFVRYDKRPSLFHAKKFPKKYDKQDLLDAMMSLYPEIPCESWHVEKKFAVLRDPRDLLLMELSY